MSPELPLSQNFITAARKETKTRQVADIATNLYMCDLLCHYFDKVLSWWKKPEILQRMRDPPQKFDSLMSGGG